MKDKTTKEDHPLRDKGMPPMLFRDNHGELNVLHSGYLKDKDLNKLQSGEMDVSGHTQGEPNKLKSKGTA